MNDNLARKLVLALVLGLGVGACSDPYAPEPSTTNSTASMSTTSAPEEPESCQGMCRDDYDDCVDDCEACSPLGCPPVEQGCVEDCDADRQSCIDDC